MEAAKKEAESPGGINLHMDVDEMAEEDEMAAMMGFGGFGTTKVRTTVVTFQARLITS
jgi:hypothetical protein